MERRETAHGVQSNPVSEQPWTQEIVLSTNMYEVEAQCDRIAEKMEKIVALYCEIQAMVLGNEPPPMVEVPLDDFAAAKLSKEREGGL